MALVAHRMMLPPRRRRTHQQVASNKVGVLLVPSIADYLNGESDQQQSQQQPPQQPSELQAGDSNTAIPDMSEQPAAFEVVDGTKKQRPAFLRTAHERAGKEINRIIEVAQKEHEALVHERGIAEMARRETIIARTYPPYSTDRATLWAEYQAELQYLQELLDEEFYWQDENI
ncbi:GH10634 [Drosophila grimshawi]|uniref:GH10634 n=1 Tax=Drosophila grimshawi TaxID=7222 RepID=B4JCT8_DROGR|nr:GH10634 [Drosophila grimshawi]